MPRPNILYLHCHDAGRYVSPYGHAIETPAIQKLATQGTLFRQAFTVNPTCSPSRAALMTGQYPHCNGMLGLAHRGHRLHDYKQTLVWALRNAGYLTALSGAQHIARLPFAATDLIGYERVLTEDSYTPCAAGEAEKFLDNAPHQPFFLDVGFHQPHRSGEGFRADFPPPDDRFLRPPAPLPDNAVTRRDMALFHASMRTADHGFGRVLDALDRNGLADNTLVICTTDHGIAFPAMKCNLTDHGMGVMLILRAPGTAPGIQERGRESFKKIPDPFFQPGKVIDAMVTHMDLYPTICELTGIPAPSFLQGKSLLPLLTGQTSQLHDAIFGEVNYHAAYEPMRCIRTDRWKYIRRYGGRTRVVLPNCDNSTSKAFWHDHQWTDEPLDDERLYDLVFDPSETNNLAAAPRCAAIRADLRTRLDQWMRDTHDPILRGPIPLPEGGLNTDANAYAPDGAPRNR